MNETYAKYQGFTEATAPSFPGQAYGAQEATAIGTALGNLEKAFVRLSMCDDRLERVASRAFGEMAAKQSAPNVPQPVPNGSVGYLNDWIDKIQDVAHRIENRINRLDEIV